MKQLWQQTICTWFAGSPNAEMAAGYLYAEGGSIVVGQARKPLDDETLI